MRWLLVLVGVLAAHRASAACDVPSPPGVAVTVDDLRATMRWPDGSSRVVDAATCAELADAVALIADIAASTNRAKPARPAKPIDRAPAPVTPPRLPRGNRAPDDSMPASTDEPKSTSTAGAPDDATRTASDRSADATAAPTDADAPPVDAAPGHAEESRDLPAAWRVEVRALDPRVEHATDAPVAALADGVSALLGAASTHGSHGWQTSLALGARARRGSYSLDLQLVATLPDGEALAMGRVEVWSTAATAAPCLHLGPFAACALASAGAVVGEGIDLASTRRAVTPLFALGGRLAMETALTARFALRLRADVLGNLAASRFDVDGMTVWATDRFGAWLGADALLRFP